MVKKSTTQPNSRGKCKRGYVQRGNKCVKQLKRSKKKKGGRRGK